MEGLQQSTEWLSVPAFGDWDKLKGMPDYSMDFSKIRESRKQSKSDYNRIYLGNHSELLSRSIVAPAASNPSLQSPRWYAAS
ncbi:hypothetical protein KSP40_PGU019531 [Platanthera guangdongensis]|uniref:RIN4 pathogenic type III effector avirulence factor Avr cleavage site domain-containing protein n=1 Tax=Platanthera guangdongensis TaxID=2320717 RepID=A0ABR2MQE9_9ASPA